MPLHSMIMEHPSKSRKLNGVGKIYVDLFDLHKYTLITTIHFMVDDVEIVSLFNLMYLKRLEFLIACS